MDISSNMRDFNLRDTNYDSERGTLKSEIKTFKEHLPLPVLNYLELLMIKI